METIQRNIYLALALSGGNPDFAVLTDKRYTVEQYLEVVDVEEYKEFAEKLEKSFFNNLDAMLMGRLYGAQEALAEVKVYDNCYPQILKAYTDLLKITAPIVERMSKIRVEVSQFDGMRLVLECDLDEDGKLKDK